MRARPTGTRPSRTCSSRLFRPSGRACPGRTSRRRRQRAREEDMNVPRILAAAAVAAFTAAGLGQAAGLAPASPASDWSVDRLDTYMITPVTGPTSRNRTDLRWYVYGTDLGHMFEHEGRLYMAFGDSF